MVVDNYGNLIEEPFHRKKWGIEIRWKAKEDPSDDWFGWHLLKSYRKPKDVQKALNDLRSKDMGWIEAEYRVIRRRYRKITGGFHVRHLQQATDNTWWRQPNKPLQHIKAVEENRIIKL